MKTTMIKMFLGASLPMLSLTAFAENATLHGVDKQNMNPNVAPGEDFYLYACQGWMDANPLKPEFSRFGTFDQLRENARTQLQDLILNLSENPESKVKGTNAQKVSDIYAMGMDSVRLNAEGAAPLKPYLEMVSNAKPEDFAKLIGKIHSIGSSPFFGTGVGSDPKNSDHNIMHMGEAGLTLGDRDYYLEDNETNRKIMDAYKKYIVRIMTLAGCSDEDAKRICDNVIDLETKFAQNKMTREERRNPLNRFNMRTMDEVRRDYPNFDWDTYFSTLGVEGLEEINLISPKFLAFLNEMLPQLTWQQVQDYLLYDTVSDASNLLSDDFSDANFELFGRVMSGKEEPEARWKRAMAIPNSMLGEAVGELYVSKYFPAESKEAMKKLVENLRAALGTHIDQLTWMSDSTKAKAREKLAGFTVKIGYPDKWKDYSAIEIDPSKTYLDNVQAASAWYVKDNYDKLKKPVDKTEWHMTPQTVNAYYNPTTNEICFPAAILQPPYFDATADDALNYGAIGVVIGHEMTHGFDDSGRKYDVNGNLNDWWQPSDAEKFTELADALVAQFDAVEVAPGVHANGRFTLGENIADQGGLRVARTAYLKSLADKGMPEGEVIDGLTPMQRFYLNYGLVWAGNIRPEEILNRVKIDSHSLGKDRVNVSLRNIGEFFDAFSIKEGDKMYRPAEERVIIW